MSDICSKNDCTGCKLCSYICPKKCISFQKDELGVLYPVIDKDKCISCHLCENNCPAKQDLEYKMPQNVYAGWSTDLEIRNSSTSGGIAQELYKYALENNYSTYGVVYNNEGGGSCDYIKVESIKQIKKVIGSKYCYADLSTIFKCLENDILNDKKVLFIGLPCQVVAVKRMFIKANKIDNLILIDLACHGVVPSEYLKQHVSNISKKYNKDVSNVTFRDKNSSYYLSLYDNNFQKFYSKNPYQDDVYYRGFTNNLALRENCYHCHYARNERISDITLGDFNGSKDSRISESDRKQVSVILENTKKGADLINYLIFNKNIVVFKQNNIIESIKYNKALNSPAIKHKNRKIFEQNYIVTNNYKKSATKALKSELIKYRILFLPKKSLKLVPKSIKKKIKKILNRR